MVNRVYEFMIRHNMIVPGSRILAAVSGGADSMCLLEVLSTLRPRAGFGLRVLHVHHGLRDSADNDLEHVSKYCTSAGIPFQAVRVDAGGYAAENGMSVEEAARYLRYEALEQAAREWDEEERAKYREEPAGYGEAAQSEMSGEFAMQDLTPPHNDSGGARFTPCRIAVAHHIEDQTETVLFNMLRGSRLTGLRGMLPVNGRIIRPMLEVSRTEIEGFLQQRGISWCEDETNEDVRYTRNMIRKEVMPLLLKINAGARKHIARAAQEAAEIEEFLQFETERTINVCCEKREISRQEVSLLKIPALLEEPDLIRRRVVYAVIADAAGGKKDVQDVHVQAVLRLMEKKGNGELDLVGGVHVKKSYELLYFDKAAAPNEFSSQSCAAAPALDEAAPDDGRNRDNGTRAADGSTPPANDGTLPASGGTVPEGFTCRVFPFDGDMDAVPRNQYTKWFDYDKIGAFPEFRTRREGDRITLDESGRSKSIARYMIDRKIPKELRDRIVMPAIGSEILWVPASAAGNLGRISAAYKVSGGTRTILEIRLEPVS